MRPRGSTMMSARPTPIWPNLRITVARSPSTRYEMNARRVPVSRAAMTTGESMALWFTVRTVQLTDARAERDQEAAYSFFPQRVGEIWFDRGLASVPSQTMEFECGRGTASRTARLR